VCVGVCVHEGGVCLCAAMCVRGWGWQTASTAEATFLES